jgi:hypothetical protein
MLADVALMDLLSIANIAPRPRGASTIPACHAV